MGARYPPISQAREPTARPDLAAMRMTRELKINAELTRALEDTGPVREEHERAIGVPTCQCSLQGLVGVNERAELIVDAREIEPGSAGSDEDSIVPQCTPTELLAAAHPGIRAGVDVVVAGNEVHPVSCRKRSERLDLPADVLDLPIDEIASHCHEVWKKRVHAIGDFFRKAPAMDRADVEVGDLNDPKSIEMRWPAIEVNVDPLGGGGPKPTMQCPGCCQ